MIHLACLQCQPVSFRANGLIPGCKECIVRRIDVKIIGRKNFCHASYIDTNLDHMMCIKIG